VGATVVSRLGLGAALTGEPFDNGWLRVALPSYASYADHGWVVLDPQLRGLRQDILRWKGPSVAAIFSEAVVVKWPTPPWTELRSGHLVVEWAWAHGWEQEGVPDEPDTQDCRSDTVGADCRHITIGGLPPGLPVKLRVLTRSAGGHLHGIPAPCFIRSAWIDVVTLPPQAEVVLEDTHAAELPLTGSGLVCYPYVDEFHDAACQRRCACRGCRFCGQWVFDGRAPRRFQCRRCGCHANEHELGSGDAPPRADPATPSRPSQPAVEELPTLTRSQVLGLQNDLVAALMDDGFQEDLHAAWTSAGSDTSQQKLACQRVCFPVQAAVAARHGFKASHRGVGLCKEAIDCHAADPDVAKNRALLEWLASPSLQAECPIGAMPGAGSAVQAAVPVNPEDLPLERCLALQRDLLARYKTRTFQDRLWKAWWAAGDNPRDQHRARQLVCFEVQASVLPRYGFEASRKGVVASHCAMQRTPSDEKELQGAWLYWLADPARQLEQPRGPLQEAPSNEADPPPSRVDVLAMVPGPELEQQAIQVRVVGGLTSNVLCVVDVGSDDSVADLKCAICSRLGTPECQQQLLLGSRPLHDTEAIGAAVRRFVRQQEPESGEDAVFDFVDISLVRMAADVERDQMLAALRSGRMRFVDCPEDAWADRNVVFAAVQGGDSSALRFAPAPLRHDRDFVLAVVTLQGNALRYAGPELLGDRDIILAAVGGDGSLLGMASEALQEDREVVLAAVWNTGRALAHASGDLQSDRHLVLTAVWKDGLALKYAAESLRKDREVCLTAVQSHGFALEYVAPKLSKDREMVLTAVQSRGAALAFAHPRWQRDREVCLAAVRQAGTALKYVHAELQNDFQVAMAAVREDKNALQFVGHELAQNPSFMHQAIGT